MDTANTLWDLALSKPALRIFNVVVFAVALAVTVTAHVLWYHGKISLEAELTTMAVALLIAAGTIVGEGLLHAYERRTQRGFRVIPKDERSDE